MKANDVLLNRMIDLDEKKKRRKVIALKDELIHNPKEIKVASNEIVYVHFFCSKNPSFAIEMVTPTGVINYNSNSTLFNASNQIVKCLGTVKFNTKDSDNFYIQYIRTEYRK